MCNSDYHEQRQSHSRDLETGMMRVQRRIWRSWQKAAGERRATSSDAET